MLRDLTTADPANPALWSDLAAAQTVLAQRSDQPVALVDAIVSAERALRLAPGLPEARFNRALASSLLGLRPDAERAWKDVIDGEAPGSAWRTEAQARLTALASDDPAETWVRAQNAINLAAERGETSTVRLLVQSHRAAARLWIENEVLFDWAVAWRAGHREQADRILARARMIAAQLAAIEGDPMLADAIAVIDRGRGGDRDALAEGHRLYGDAVRRSLRVSPEETLKLYRGAAAAFRRAGSPFAAWAEVGRAISFYQQYRIPEAVAVLDAQRATAERAHYVNLQARLLWIRAVCEFFTSLPPMARNSYRAALQRYLETGERENLANVHVRLAEVYRLLGRRDLAWRHLHQAALELPRVVNPRSRSYILGSTANALLETGAPGAAQHLLEKAVAIARRDPSDPVPLAVALRDYAEFEPGCWTIESRHSPSSARHSACPSRSRNRSAAPSGRAFGWSRVRLPRTTRQHGPSRPFPEHSSFCPATNTTAIEPDFLQRAAAYRNAADSEETSGRPQRAQEMRQRATADLARSLAEIDVEWEQVLARRQRGEDEELWSSYFWLCPPRPPSI